MAGGDKYKDDDGGFGFDEHASSKHFESEVLQEEKARKKKRIIALMVILLGGLGALFFVNSGDDEHPAAPVTVAEKEPAEIKTENRETGDNLTTLKEAPPTPAGMEGAATPPVTPPGASSVTPPATPPATPTGSDNKTAAPSITPPPAGDNKTQTPSATPPSGADKKVATPSAIPQPKQPEIKMAEAPRDEKTKTTLAEARPEAVLPEQPVNQLDKTTLAKPEEKPEAKSKQQKASDDEKGGVYFVQVKATSDGDQALALRDELLSKGFNSWIYSGRVVQNLYSVNCGTYKSIKDASGQFNTLKDSGYAPKLLYTGRSVVISLGVFDDKGAADNFAARITAAGIKTNVEKRPDPARLFIVRVGKFNSSAIAGKEAKKLKLAGYHTIGVRR